LAKSLLRAYFDYADMNTVISDGVKVGLHEGLVTLKLSGQYEVVPRYIAVGSRAIKSDSSEWRLRAVVLPAEDYFPDPNPGAYGKLYEIHQMLVDRYSLLALSSSSGRDSEKPYFEEIVSRLEGTWLESEARKARNRGESVPRRRADRRKPILVDEFYGTVLDRDGKVFEWKKEDGSLFPLRNVLVCVGNGKRIVLGPIENPRWAATSPFISAPILRVPFATWPKAIMDAASSLNLTLNELFNLMLDGGLSSVHGIKQLHEDWLTPETIDEIGDYIPAGTTLVLNANAPKDGSVMERVDTGGVPGDALAFFNIVNQLFAENALSNEIKLGGMPQKQVRATEVVASQQAISGIFDGLASDFEDVFVEKLAEQAWMDILQNVKKFPKKDLIRLIGEKSYAELNALSPAARFERAGKGFKWKGKVIRTIAARMRDFQKWVQFLAQIGQNPLMLQEFQMKFSMPKMLGKYMTSLEIDPEELLLSESEKQAAEMRRQMQEEAINAMKMEKEGGDVSSPGGPSGGSAEVPQESGAEAGMESGSGGAEANPSGMPA